MTRVSNAKKIPTPDRNNSLCRDCDACCKYVSVEIDKPATKAEIEDIKFYLYHKDASVYIDHDNDWYILFKSRCNKLDSNGLCTIYEDRPPICKNFERDSCHKEDWNTSHKVLFQDVNDLMRYLRRRRPAFYKRYYSSLSKQQSGQGVQNV